MLRQVFITKDGNVIYRRDYGKALDSDGFRQAYKQISHEAFKLAVDNTKSHDYFTYRLHYLSVPDHQIIFLFVSDLSDKFENVKKELSRCRKEFMDMFGSILDEKIDEDTFEIFDPTIELIHKNLRPKISLVGFSGVGKTTITRLITADDIPMEHIPTITGDIGTIKIGKLHFHLWDFAGQEQFSFLWNNFIKGSDAVFLITDSTLENCEKSKYFVELIKKEAPTAHTAAIGNKQDIPGALSIADIERHLTMKAYSMIAVDPGNRDKMITIIADVLEMSGEVSPLLKPLIERDKKLKEAEHALEIGDFQKGIELFDALADLCLELGDDRVSQDFHEKAQKIRAILAEFGPITPTEPSTPEISESHPSEQVSPLTSEPPRSTPSPPALLPQEITTVAKIQSQKMESRPSSSSELPPPPLSPTSAAPAPIVPPSPPSGITPSEKGAAPPPLPLSPSSVTPAPMIPPPPPSGIIIPEKGAAPPSPLSPSSVAPTPMIPPLSPGEIKKSENVATPSSSLNISPPSSTPPLKPGSSSAPQIDKLGMMLEKLKAKPAVPSTLSRSPTSAKISLQDNKVKGAEPPIVSSNPSSPSVNIGIEKEQLITDLKIKIANVNKTELDLEMQNITGELSDVQYRDKLERLKVVKQKFEDQLKEIQG